MNVIVNLNKPEGMSSQQAVTKVKNIFGAKKAGHAGTLDPLATGVLLICLGEATKTVRFLMDKEKEYAVRIKLGERTDTLDSTGTVTENLPIPALSEQAISAAARGFRGLIAQTPPMYSAIKYMGEPLYALARKGLVVDRPTRIVEIHDIKVTGIDLPYIDLTVSCSKGTYIRSLCDDFGVKLGTVAHVVSLERIRVGAMTVEQSAQLDQLSTAELQQHSFPFIHSIDSALSELHELLLCDEDYKRAMNGVPLSTEILQKIPENPFVRLKSPAKKIFGIGRIENTRILIDRILNC